MKVKFNDLFNNLINVIYGSLVIIGILGAANRLLGVFTNNLSSKDVLILDVIAIIGILIFKFRKKIPMKKISILLGILLVAWQMYIVKTCSGFSTWDPGIVMLTATEHFSKVWVNINQYFSTNPNMIPLLLIEHGLWCLFNKPNLTVFTVALGMLNILLIDISLVMISISTKKMFKSNMISNTANLFGIIIMGITPWMCIIYSDNIALFLAAVELLIISLWKEKSNKGKLLLSAILGVVFIVDLLIKPSTIIFFIGIAVIAIFNFKKIKFTKKSLVYLITFAIAFLAIGTGYKALQNNNSLVKINKSETLPLSHFAAMGIQGNGGYSLKDVETDDAIKNPQQRNQVAQKRWRKRYNNMGGLGGYERFLVNKQSVNLAMGSMDWGCEGVFLTPFNQSKKVKATLPRKLFTSNDGIAHIYTPSFFVFVQIFWCLGLILMLGAVLDKHVASQLLKIIFIGFCAFLLLFESGRSRYLIQFLPFIFALIGIGNAKITTIYKKIKEILN